MPALDVTHLVLVSYDKYLYRLDPVNSNTVNSEL